MKVYLRIVLLIAATTFTANIFAQGEVGIGTNTPVEKLDVNGAVIVSGNAAMATPVAGTIKYNSATGYHDGYLSTGTWAATENYNEYLYNGDYTGLSCGYITNVNIGAITGTSTGPNETPFATQYSDKRAQYLYLGSELLAWGLCAGDITEAAWNVVTIGSPGAINGFTIKMKLTTTTSLVGTAWETSLSTVYGPASFSIATGLNTFVLSTPFTWDGASNLLIEICYDNSTGSTNTNVDWTSPVGFNGTRYAQAATGAGCVIAAASGVSTARPVVYLTGNTAGAITGIDDYLFYEKGVVVGNPVLPAPYVHHGPGTLTAESVYDENIQLSDYVFDTYFDGTLHPDDAEKYKDYQQFALEDMINYMETHRHLPTMTGREEWKLKGQSSVGKLATELWVTYETHALYIKELHEQITAMENLIAMATDPLTQAYVEEIKLIQEDEQMTPELKQQKINELLLLIEDLKKN